MAIPITGPIAPYTNPPIEPQYYIPWRFQISAISLGVTTIVTMVIPSITFNNYVIGQEVRLIIPPLFGCRELNGVTGYVISIPSSNQVELNIFSSGMNAFIAASARTQAQILPIGDNNYGNISTTGRVNLNIGIPGAFKNISPL